MRYRGEDFAVPLQPRDRRDLSGLSCNIRANGSIAKKSRRVLAFCGGAVYIMEQTQSCGVTVAQVILVHFVEVRILTGLPFCF